MKYVCNKCKKSYTLPIGDKMIERKEACKCGESPILFKISKCVVIEGAENAPFLFTFC